MKHSVHLNKTLALVVVAFSVTPLGLFVLYYHRYLFLRIITLQGSASAGLFIFATKILN
jgi:hypothetical protein